MTAPDPGLRAVAIAAQMIRVRRERRETLEARLDDLALRMQRMTSRDRRVIERRKGVAR